MGYFLLTLAIASEVLGTSLLKITDGFTRLWPSAACLLAYALSFVLLSQVVKTVPVGVAYAMWAGLGTVAIVAIGSVFFGETLGLVKIVGLILVIGGVVMLNLNVSH